jgi:hypothetical protein
MNLKRNKPYRENAPFLKAAFFHLKGHSHEQSVLNVQMGYALKGQCHEIFDPRFFSSNYPP